MIHIAVCDDDIGVTKNIHEYLMSKEKQLQDETLNTLIYHSGEAFLKDIELGAIFHIVLMDIQMNGINGVKVGELLRSRPGGDDIIMVYISGHGGYFEDLVNVGSFRFVKKPIDYNDLDDVFTRATNQAIKHKAALNAPEQFMYKVGLDTHTVRRDKIAYIKKNLRLAELYAWDDIQQDIKYVDKFYAKLDRAMLQLPEDQFLHCERSYVVNLAFVSNIEKDAFTLSNRNATRIPISKSCRIKARQAYFKYLELEL